MHLPATLFIDMQSLYPEWLIPDALKNILHFWISEIQNGFYKTKINMMTSGEFLSEALGENLLYSISTVALLSVLPLLAISPFSNSDFPASFFS